MSNQIEFVSIIIPVFNEERYLSDCLRSLRNNHYPLERYEIIVVDNGSTDNSRSIARTNADHVLLYPDVNVGAVRNHGVKYARGTIIAFLDSDCTVHSNWIQSGVDYLHAQQSLIVGGCLFLRNNPGWVERLWLLQDSGKKVVQPDLLGSCTIIRKSDFQVLNGFDEDVTSGEDSDLSLRARQTNFTVRIYESLGVVHLGNPTTVGGFVKRQLWHSENYFQNLKASSRDAVFWLVCIYSAGWLITLSKMVIFSTPTLFTAFLILAPPAILSIKRIVRAGFNPLHNAQPLTSLIGIYLLDHLYLAGRSLGLFKGLGISIKKRR